MRKNILLVIFILVCVAIIFNITTFFSFSKKTFFPRGNQVDTLPQEKIDSEIAKLEEYLNLNPNDLHKTVDLGIYYFLKGPKFYDKSINILDNAWRMGALDERIFYYLGNMYEFLKLYNFAIMEYKKYLNNVKNDIETQIRLGNLYYLTSKLDDAIMMYEDILRKDKNNIIAMTNLATIFFEKKDYTDAKEYLTKVKDVCKKKSIVEPKNVNFYLGKIDFFEKNYVSAIKWFKEELNLYPENSTEVKVFLTKTFFEMKDYPNTILYGKEVLKVNPDNKEIKILISKIPKTIK
jgi:tetratricopeptide (TPR) repeat protein